MVKQFKQLHYFTQAEVSSFISKREGEQKLGETVHTIRQTECFSNQIKHSSAKFVLFGVPEDIGVQLNGGQGGAHTAFFPALKAFLNIQENQFISGKDVLILGYFNVLETVETFNSNTIKKGSSFIKQMDEELSELMCFLVSLGKTPIIIGGGHNNAYGNIKGTSTALKQAINVVNFDAHTDLRRLEHRHSGNGFSYAIHEGYLNNYFIFGLHENYTPQYIFDYIHEKSTISYTSFEALEVYKSAVFDNELIRAENFVNTSPYGIEIDLDAIQSFPSSAMSPCGFSTQEARRFVYKLGKNQDAKYLHICEGAPILSNEPNTSHQVGKLISYLISDFIKAVMH